MCPSAPVPSLVNIEFHFTDEELVEHLERMVRGASLPENVIKDVNPYNVSPRDLHDEIWYFFNSEDAKATPTGYWKAIGEGRKIPKDDTTFGCLTTLVFYEGRAPCGTKTDWMMYEYKLCQEGLSEKNEVQDSSTLCRVFLNSIQSPNHEEHQNRTRADDANGDYNHPKPAIGVDEYGSSMSQVNYGIDENGPTAVSDRYLLVPEQGPDNLIQDLDENYDFSEGDFLELLDLVNPESPSSSENSSCLTLSTEECFDSMALLRDIEAENTQKKPDKVQQYSSMSLRARSKKHVAVQGPSTNSANAVASSSGLPAY